MHAFADRSESTADYDIRQSWTLLFQDLGSVVDFEWHRMMTLEDSRNYYIMIVVELEVLHFGKFRLFASRENPPTLGPYISDKMFPQRRCEVMMYSMLLFMEFGSAASQLYHEPRSFDKHQDSTRIRIDMSQVRPGVG
jgi:hypothetical protein